MRTWYFAQVVRRPAIQRADSGILGIQRVPVGGVSGQLMVLVREHYFLSPMKTPPSAWQLPNAMESPGDEESIGLEQLARKGCRILKRSKVSH